MSDKRSGVVVRRTRPDDIPELVEVCKRVYPGMPPWSESVLAQHRMHFPAGQLVAVDRGSGRVLGMAASLIIRWRDYNMQHTYAEITANGTFANHDPKGKTLYGAEVMVDPRAQGQGVGKALYKARRELVRSFKLVRIRAGARLRHYHRHADRLSAEQYVQRVVRGELTDPTLSFQLGRGFRVLAVVQGYMPRDEESLGYAAIIEWLSPERAKARHYAGRDPRFTPPA